VTRRTSARIEIEIELDTPGNSAGRPLRLPLIPSQREARISPRLKILLKRNTMPHRGLSSDGHYHAPTHIEWRAGMDYLNHAKVCDCRRKKT